MNAVLYLLLEDVGHALALVPLWCFGEDSVLTFLLLGVLVVAGVFLGLALLVHVAHFVVDAVTRQGHVVVSEGLGAVFVLVLIILTMVYVRTIHYVFVVDIVHVSLRYLIRLLAWLSIIAKTACKLLRWHSVLALMLYRLLSGYLGLVSEFKCLLSFFLIMGLIVG